MTDPSLVRVLARQTPRKVGLVRHAAVARGAPAIRARFDELEAEGVGIAIVDALADADLHAIGAACADLPLVTGGSGVAIGLPENFRRAGLLGAALRAAELPPVGGPAVVLSGSCSVASNAQVRHWIASGRPAFRVDALRLGRGEDVAGEAIAWALTRMAAAPVLVYATATPDEVKTAQSALGVETAGSLVEHCLAEVGRTLAARGARRFVVAGGETSGAVVKALDVTALRIGPQIDPGVPWTATPGPAPLALALKSGNFGTVDFFAKALAMLDAPG